MRKSFTIFSLLLSCLLSIAAYADTTIVSKADALTIAKRQFRGKDVDIYLLSDNSKTVWTFFVDAEPMKGWEHECYTLTIPKTTTSSLNLVTPISKLKRKVPPTGNYTPISVKNRYGDKYNSKPSVQKSSLTNEVLTAAQRTYAIILNGGINQLSNYERYWNDSSFIYQTLVNKYGVPKSNIFPIMSDGDSSYEDMRLTTGALQSQPLDLDYDGVDDIKLAATKANIQTTLDSLANKMVKDDHLFFYVIDHGGTTDSDTNSYICLWNNEKLYDEELATMLEPFTNKFVNVNVVLGQCYSGGFNDNLTKVGCVVASACTGSESSWACSDIPYDEFVYQWTCAVNGATHTGESVTADSDNNNRVTMLEAFEYAKQMDRRTDETPQYVSTPTSVGEDLSFNNLAPSVDLYVKDNSEDSGKEPNLTTDIFWNSPSICVRNQDDGIFEHENPEYSEDHQMAYIYVKIENRGKEEFDGKGKWLIVYWAQASTGLSAKVWKGREIYENGDVTGGHLEPASIGEIEPGGYTTLKLNWALPRLLQNYPDGNFHFCLYAKLMDTPYDDGYVEGENYFDVKGSNDQAQKNLTIIRKKDLSKGFNVFVRNVESSDKVYTLELIPKTESDSTLFSLAKVEMEMSPKIYTAWKRGGFVCQDIELPSTNADSTELRTVKFVSAQSKIQQVALNANEFDIVKLKFKFTRYTSSSTYTLDLVQKDEDGNIVGGETFIVESPSRTVLTTPISATEIEDGQYQLEVDEADAENVTWLNSAGDTIGNDNSIVVTPTINNNSFSAVAITEDGDVAIESISLEYENGIDSVSTVGTGYMDITFKACAYANSIVYITSVLDGTTPICHSVPEGCLKTTIEISALSKGIYTLTYATSSGIIDQLKLNID